jgi:hypothetical protein
MKLRLYPVVLFFLATLFPPARSNFRRGNGEKFNPKHIGYCPSVIHESAFVNKRVTLKGSLASLQQLPNFF